MILYFKKYTMPTLAEVLMTRSPTLTPNRPNEPTHRVVLPHVSWSTYQALLTDLGDGRSTRLAYDRGILEIIMPSNI